MGGIPAAVLLALPMKPFRRFGSISARVLLFAVAAPLLAQVTAVSNVGQPNSANVGIGKQISGGFDFSLGFSFTTGTSDLTFLGVTVPLMQVGASSGLLLTLRDGFSVTGP